MNNEELRSLVNPLGAYKKLVRLIPALSAKEPPNPDLQDESPQGHLKKQVKTSLSFINKLKKANPSTFARKSVSSLFSGSSSSQSKGNSTRVFDPAAELVVSEAKRKKKSSHPRPVSITVVMLPSLQKSIPRGSQRSQLEKQGRIKKIGICRHTTDDEVHEAIESAFKNIFAPNLTSWQILECIDRNQLIVATKEVTLTAEHAIERRGGLYLCQLDEKVGITLPILF